MVANFRLNEFEWDAESSLLTLKRNVAGASIEDQIFIHGCIYCVRFQRGADYYLVSKDAEPIFGASYKVCVSNKILVPDYPNLRVRLPCGSPAATSPNCARANIVADLLNGV